MSFFSELKETLETGGSIVTKTVQGKNTEVGRKKIQLIEEMRAQGYELVNEIAESGIIEGFLGDSAGTKYTLTFQLNEQLVAEIKAKEEKRRKEEEERVRRQKRDEAVRLGKEQKEEELRKREYDEKIEQLKEPLGSGWSVVAAGGKNAKNAIKAVKAFMKEQDWNSLSKKMYLKEFKNTMKRNGKVLALNNYGENLCKMFCEKLNKMKCEACVEAYDEAMFAAQRTLTGLNGIIDDYVSKILSNVVYNGKPTTEYKKLLAAAQGKKTK